MILCLFHLKHLNIDSPTLKMADQGILTPTSTLRYELRSRTPVTPKSQGPIKSEPTFNDPSTAVQKNTLNPFTPKCLIFKTPMKYKPALIGNKPVSSPSREELWKQQLGLTEDNTCCNSDKENSSSDNEESQKCQVSLVEYRALQRVLAERNVHSDKIMLQIKNYKDKICNFKMRLAKEETTKRQQIKILQKSYEVQMQEKEQLLNNLQSIVTEQEEKIKELEESKATTSRKRGRPAKNIPSESVAKLVDDIKRLLAEKAELVTQLNEVQIELDSVRENNSNETVMPKDDSLLNGTGDKCGHNVTTSQLFKTCSTDTEKQLNIYLAEKEQLLQDLSEARNAHIQAVTESKLFSHREQKLAEDVKGLKLKITDLEAAHARIRETQKTVLQQEMTKLGEENGRLHLKVRELQEEILILHAKATEMKEVESESLKKQYEMCQAEVQDLKKTDEAKKLELYEAERQIRYLERILKMTQMEKDEADASLWKELESLNNEHQITIQKLRDSLEIEKQNALQNCENRLLSEHKEQMHKLVETMNSKLISEINAFEEMVDNVKESHKTALVKQTDIHISAMEKEKARFKQEINRMYEKFDTEKQSICANYDTKRKQLEEDLTIAKSVALTQLQEELTLEKEHSLQEQEKQLHLMHLSELSEMKEAFGKELEQAVLKERAITDDKINCLETKFSQFLQELSTLQSVKSAIVQSYILLQQEFKQFQNVMCTMVTSVQNELVAALTGISEYNKELVTKYQQEMKLRKKYHNELVQLRGNIRVFCRVRPIIKEDGVGQLAEKVVSIDPGDDGLLYINSKGRIQSFDVDRVFGEHCMQAEVFDEVKAVVISCIDGYNVCLFAYGQTGSGKTYTMEGTKEEPGINQRALCQLFTEASSRLDWEYTITVSVLEIYNDTIRDLLGDNISFKMEVKINPDGGFHIPGLRYVTVKSVEDVNECFRVGYQNRATAATNLNEHSSRSHALLCVTVVGVNTNTAARTTGKLNLVDLAGSERVSKSKADGTWLKEAQCINKSLSALGDVIYALRSKQSHIPYRNSKLTYLLQDSLGGDSKTLMITQISPVRKNEGETICSLNFAQRVRNVELGTATRKVENVNSTESDSTSPSRIPSTPQSGNLPLKPNSPTNTGTNCSTPSFNPMTMKSTTPSNYLAAKQNTPLSSSKRTPMGRKIKKQ